MSKTCPFRKGEKCTNKTVLSGKGECYHMSSEVKVTKMKKKEVDKMPKTEPKKEIKEYKIKITSGTLKGEYDRYTVEDGIVSLNNIKISTVEDVENYRSKLIIEAEKRVNELIEVIRMVM